MPQSLPPIIQEVGFEFRWDERKVWKLELPSEEMRIEELTWHLDIPFLWSRNGASRGFYDLKPSEVLKSPAQHADEYERVMIADTHYPIDIMWWKQRWVILDGLHRLMKLALEQKSTVLVRKVPTSAIPLITK